MRITTAKAVFSEHSVDDFTTEKLYIETIGWLS